ncbi:MAG: SGNH/GDSL hydrolase family protein [Deltaproteobacteria bacterium]|nr:SGNH/GDSL hydrolase family protein [Deltaproteobacteria bacterium]
MGAFHSALMVALVGFLLTGTELLLRNHLSHSGDPLERSWLLLRPDRSWGWQQRENLETLFYDKHVKTDSNGFRSGTVSAAAAQVVVAGPSSTFGWGVEDDETYSARLQQGLKQIDASVVNVGQIGFSLPQGLLFLRNKLEIKNIAPRYLILAYGVNELDRNRFFFQSEQPDLEVFGPPRAALQFRITQLAHEVLLFPWLIREAFKLFGTSLCSSGLAQRLTVRVPLADFIKSLDEAESLARTYKLKLIYLTTVARFAEAPAQRPVLDPCASLRVAEETRIASSILEYNASVSRWGAQNDVPVLELANVVSAGPDSADFIDPFHFSALGHAKIGKALAAFILKMERQNGPKKSN